MVFDGGLVDALAFHDVPSPAALAPYLPEGWRETLGAAPRLAGLPLHVDPLGHDDPGSRPAEGPAGSDLGLFTEQLLDRANARVVVGFDRSLLAGRNRNHFAAVVAMRALNDWSRDAWLARESRVFGLVAVPTVVPVEGAAEIRRLGADERFVGVELAGTGLDRGFGHPVYTPIIEAAVELGLPLVIRTDVDSVPIAAAPSVGAGVSSTYAESRIHAWHTHVAQMSNLIMQGVFDRFPTLKVLLVGSGAVWVAGNLWRLDHRFKVVGEARWLTRLPSEYFLDHFAIGTYRLERPPRPELLESALAALPGIESVLLYTSGYPRRDWDTPEAQGARLPDAWHDLVFHENAERFFRWPGQGAEGNVGAVPVPIERGA